MQSFMDKTANNRSIQLQRAGLALLVLLCLPSSLSGHVAFFPQTTQAGARHESFFIRAPVVERVGEGVEVLARLNGDPVLCRQGVVTVAAFHPELSDDARLHRRWLDDAGL